jgi:zinc protease
VQEVDDAKRALLEERRLSRGQDARVAAALAEQAYVGRSFAYSAAIDSAIEALTAEQVTAALRKYVKRNGFAFVYAGDFAKHRK